MKNGDIGLEMGEDFLSKAIEEFERGKYSHATAFVDGKLIEAEGFKKTGYAPLDKYKGKMDFFTCDNLDDIKREKIKEFLNSEVGSHYDYLLLLIEAVRYALHIVLPYKEPYRSHICSTLVSDAYKSVGVNLCKDVKYPSPDDLSKSKLLRKI